MTETKQVVDEHVKQLPNFGEADLIEVWRFRQEHKDSEDFHHERRVAADAEILRRAVDSKAEILPTEAGDIFIVYSSTYAYDTGAVDRVLFPLIEAAGLQAEWNQFVGHRYKIDRRWLNRLLKRGPEWIEAVDRISMATTGQPRVGNGPSLSDLGGYAPEQEGILT